MKNVPLNLSQKKFIANRVSQGCSSREIAEELGVSIWVVRKWRQRLKKGLRSLLLWADRKKEV